MLEMSYRFHLKSRTSYWVRGYAPNVELDGLIRDEQPWQIVCQTLRTKKELPELVPAAPTPEALPAWLEADSSETSGTIVEDSEDSAEEVERM